MAVVPNCINGINFPPFVEQKKLDELADFPLRADDVFVVTYPKSGTVWTKYLVYLIKKNCGAIPADDQTAIDGISVWIERQGKDAAMAFPTPRTFMSHMPYHMMPGGDPDKSPAKYIYVIRDPKDVAVSFYYMTQRVKFIEHEIDWNTFFEIFLAGKAMFGSWFDHVLEWWKHKDADNILFLKFEDMKKDLRGTVEKISQFIGYNVDAAAIDEIAEMGTFENMKANPLANPDNTTRAKEEFKEGSGSFMRKGIVGDWKNHFTDEQLARFEAEYSKRMTGSGLDYM